MAKKSAYATVSGNDYSDAAAGARSWGTSNGWNNTGVSTGADSRNKRGAELPPKSKTDYDLTGGQSFPDLNDVMKGWR